jgi:hypothetical protein
MSYIPFGMTPESPTGPNMPIINDKTPAKTLQSIATYVSTPILTSIGANVVFTTAPDKGRFIPTAIWFCPTIATGASATPVIRIGFTNSGTVYSDWVASYTFLSSRALYQYWEIPLKADAGGTSPTARRSAPPSTDIVFYVSTASTVPCAGDVVISGFYTL